MFAIGVAVERNQEHSETSTSGTQQLGSEAGPVPGSESGEGGEAGETPADEDATGAQRNGASGSDSAESTESRASLLGVNPESIATAVAAVVVPVLLAAVVGWRPSRPVLLLGAGFCVVAALLDVREIAHQLDLDRDGVAALAALVTVLHLSAASAAALVARTAGTAGAVASAAD